MKGVGALGFAVFVLVLLTSNVAVYESSPFIGSSQQGGRPSPSGAPRGFAVALVPGLPEPLNSMPPDKNPPAYAFDGAYAKYNVTASGFAVHGYVYKTSVGYLVNSLDLQSGTFSVESSYEGEFSYLSTTVTASFDSPSPLPAVSAQDLAYLNRGEVPVDMIVPPNMSAYPPVMGVKSNVTVSVPAGSFVVDELSLANESEEWVAVRSGLVIRETGAFSASSWPDGVYGTMVLASTNIPEGGQPPDYGILEANAALVILVVLGAVLAWRIGSRQRPAKAGAARTGG